VCRTYIKIILAFVLLLTLAGCTKYNYPSTNTKFNHNLQFKPGKDLLGLATPIQLQRGDNAIDLRDYFYSCTIDSVKSDISLPFILDKINQKVNINITETTPPLSNLSLFSGKNKYDILVKSPTKKEHILRLKDNNYSKVQIKGEMNAWNPASTLVYLKDGEWLTKLELTPGAYQYKYIVDGEEITDPNNKDMVSKWDIK